jgi:hypothetical protein
MKTLNIFSALFALAAAATTTACSSADATAEQVVSTKDPLTYGGPHLLWKNTTTGALKAWVLNGSTVTGTEFTTPGCGPTDCGTPIDVVNNTVLWDDIDSGRIRTSSFDNGGVMSLNAPYSWTCDTSSGCGWQWRAIGRSELSVPGSLAKQQGILWHNPSTGAVSIWDVSGSTVTGTRNVGWDCGAANGCSLNWRAMLTADMNHDGNTDILWYNASTGQLSSWLLDSSGRVSGTQNVAWTCNKSSGCADEWRLVGAADVNLDGNIDLSWHNATTGKVSNWLLDGRGSVVGTSELSQLCDSGTMVDGGASCANEWKAIGYITFPPRL